MIHFRLLRLVSPDGRGVLAGVFVGLVLSALAIGQALATSTLFTGILARSALGDLTLPLVVLAAALLLRPLATATRELVAHAVASGMKRDVRARILDHEAARGPFAGGDEHVGAHHALLVDGVENLEPYITRYVPQVAVTAVTTMVTITMLALIDPVIGAVVGATALVVPLVPRLWDRALRGRGEEHWSAYAAVHADVTDAIRGMETLKLLGAVDRRRAELAEGSRSLLRATLRQLRLSLVESGLTGFLLVAGPALALATGVARVTAGTLEPTALFAVALIGFEVFRPFRDLSHHWHAGYLGVTAGTRLLAQLSTSATGVVVRESEEELVSNTRIVPSPETAVELANVHARYPDAERTALDGISLRILRGSVTAIVGPSGSGKSTVANVILGLLPTERGHIAVAASEGVAPVTLVSQDPVLLSGTLRENLALVAPHSDEAALRHALERAQASELLLGEHSLDAQVGDRGALLSGGQRQRVAIARALLRGSPILLLDEASSALDAQRERALFAGLRQDGEGDEALTVVVIAHRLSAIRDADHIIVLDDGRVVEQGRYQDLVIAGGVFANLHAAQAEQVSA